MIKSKRLNNNKYLLFSILSTIKKDFHRIRINATQKDFKHRQILSNILDLLSTISACKNRGNIDEFND